MEKELENYSNLEIQIDKITDLVTSLKEENRQLREQNEQLMIQSQSANGKKSRNADNAKNISADSPAQIELSEFQFETVRQNVKNALLKLDQLRHVVMETN